MTPKPLAEPGLSWPSPAKARLPVDTASPLTASDTAICTVTPVARPLFCDSARSPPVELTVVKMPASAGAAKSVTKLKLEENSPSAWVAPLIVATRQ